MGLLAESRYLCLVVVVPQQRVYWGPSGDGNFMFLPEITKRLQRVYSRTFLEAIGKGLKATAHQHASKISLVLEAR